MKKKKKRRKTWFRNVNVIVSFLRLLSYWTERKSFKCSSEHHFSHALKTVNNTQNIIMVLAWNAVSIIILHISHWLCARSWKHEIKCNKDCALDMKAGNQMWNKSLTVLNLKAGNQINAKHITDCALDLEARNEWKTNHSTFLPCSSLSLSLSVTSDADMAFGRSILLAKTSNTASRRSCSCNWNHEKNTQVSSD